MKRSILWLTAIYLYSIQTISQEIIKCSFDQIDKSQISVQLRFVRIWGGEHESDAKKSFRTPTGVAVNNWGRIFIVDMDENSINEYDEKGTFIKKIGRPGQGPGDLMRPYHIICLPNGDIAVAEMDSRIQIFSSEGISKRIITIGKYIEWFDITDTQRLLYYAPLDSKLDHKIFSVADLDGKIMLRGGYNDDYSNDPYVHETLKLAADDLNQIYVANSRSPIIRQYEQDGRLVRALMYEPYDMKETKHKFNEKTRDIDIERTNGTDFGCGGIDVDKRGNIFVACFRKKQTEKELMATRVMFSMVRGIERKLVDYNIVDKIELFQILIFDQKGNNIGKCNFQGLCDKILIFDNKLFALDSVINQRITEYEIIYN